MSQQCTAVTKSGKRCRNRQRSALCPVHSPYKRKRQTVSYRAYLASPQWRAKRKAFMQSDSTSNDCYCCGKKYESGFHLHHLTYERLGNERFDDLRMVCKPCHELVHELAKKIRNIAMATHKLRIARGLPVYGATRARMRR